MAIESECSKEGITLRVLFLHENRKISTTTAITAVVVRRIVLLILAYGCCLIDPATDGNLFANLITLHEELLV